MCHDETERQQQVLQVGPNIRMQPSNVQNRNHYIPPQCVTDLNSNDKSNAELTRMDERLDAEIGQVTADIAQKKTDRKALDDQNKDMATQLKEAGGGYYQLRLN
jgi:septal ring factor EnvC (AmiA/AmiB activator)